MGENTSIMNDLKHCFGCLKLTRIYTSPTDEIRQCVYVMPNLNANCPCSYCIVKMMCEAHCTDFYTFRSNIKPRRK